MDSGRWVNKFRIVTISLMFSGALNIGLLAAVVFFAFEKTSIALAAPLKETSGKEAPANRQLLVAMSKLSFPELVAYLTNREPVEEGYSKRDLALTSLVAFHSFHLEKALSTSLKERRVFALSPTESVEMYPGLNNEQYEAIIHFAYQEKWPLTSKGLFRLLQKGAVRDESLVQAFLATPEFYVFQVLFQKTTPPQDPPLLLNLVCEGPWEALEGFVREQAKRLEEG